MGKIQPLQTILIVVLIVIIIGLVLAFYQIKLLGDNQELFEGQLSQISTRVSANEVKIDANFKEMPARMLSTLNKCKNVVAQRSGIQYCNKVCDEKMPGSVCIFGYFEYKVDDTDYMGTIYDCTTQLNYLHSPGTTLVCKCCANGEAT